MKFFASLLAHKLPKPTVQLSLITAICLLLCACGEAKRSDRLPTVPVSGEITVDGQPAVGVEVGLISTDPATKGFRPRAKTDENGKFQMTTYETGDGAPEGEYMAIFAWHDRAAAPPGGKVPDKLNGRYIKADASQTPVSVKAGTPVDMGTIALTTQ